MDFSHGLALITIVHLLAAASPGPDFVMVTQQTLGNGRKSGLLCSLGIALGLSVHIIYSAFGMATVIASSVSILTGIKILGGCYLLYLGYRGIRSRAVTGAVDARPVTAKPKSAMKTIAAGFFCNVLNPKAPLYFVSLFTVVLSPDMPLHFIAIYGAWIMILQFSWFSLVAVLLANPMVSRRFRRYGHYIDRVLGGTMIGLGLKVLTTKTP